MLGACEIIKQINQTEQDRLLALEKSEQENMAMRRKIADEMLEEMNRRIDQKTKQIELKEELDKYSNLMREMKLKKAEDDRKLDLKIQQEQQAKAVSLFRMFHLIKYLVYDNYLLPARLFSLCRYSGGYYEKILSWISYSNFSAQDSQVDK